MITVDELREAMDRGELFVEYLPIMALRERRCVGAEALVRWWHDGAVLYPSNFIPLIENTPMSGTITYWMIDTVATELGGWLGDHADAQISINVPPEILGRGGLEYAARRSGLRARADQIVLEITERGVPDRLGLAALNELADRGVRVALDDTTLSAVNLAVLTRCNFSVVKIDRSLTAQLQPGQPPPEWFTGLASLLRSTTLEVIAEGIETPYQATMLLEAGVELGQGFWFSMPLSASGLKEFYSSHPAH